MANNFVGGIISLTLGVLMLSGVFMPVVKGTNTSTWTASEVTLWGMVGLAAVIGIVYGTFAIFGLV